MTVLRIFSIVFCLILAAPASTALARGGGGGGGGGGGTIDEYVDCEEKALGSWTIGGDEVVALFQCTGDGGGFKKNVAEFTAVKGTTSGSGTFKMYTHYTNVMSINCGYIANTNPSAFSFASSDSPTSNGDLSFSSSLTTKKGEHCFAITHSSGSSVSGDGPNWDFTKIKGTCPGDLNNGRKDICAHGVVLL
jgi:hypothetical protein